MFTAEIDRSRFPVSTRLWGLALGWAIAIFVPGALVSARTLAVSFALIFALTIAAAIYRGNLRRSMPRVGPASAILVALLFYASLSALWSELPLKALEKTLIAISFAAAAGILIKTYYSEARRDILHMAEGVWMGFVVGLIYFLIELLTDQSIKIALYNALQMKPGSLRPSTFFKWQDGHLVSIAAIDLTRNTVPVVMFLWPAIVAARGTLSSKVVTRVVIWAIFALAGIVVMLSTNETSKLAFVVSTAAFVVVNYWPDFAHKVVAVTWVAICLAVVPLSIAAHRIGLHEAAWVQPTAQHRIAIWNHTATETLKAPFFGIGANMMYALYPKRIHDPQMTHKGFSTQVQHAHNVYLQTWFELGAVGAALLCLVGLAILDMIRKLGPWLSRYALATFAAAATVAGSSYGMWQIWFMALFGFTAVLFAIAARSTIKREYIPQLARGRPNTA